jgi:hypothetical protein
MTLDRLFAAGFALAMLFAGASSAAEVEETMPAQFELPRVRTSIYIGSVTLITGVFTRVDDTYTSTYEAKVAPWSFWSEAGSIALNVAADDFARLRRGETIEITGEAINGKGKPRHVSARAKATDATSGTIKVRISVSGSTLVFNSTYRVLPEADATAP